MHERHLFVEIIQKRNSGMFRFHTDRDRRKKWIINFRVENCSHLKVSASVIPRNSVGGSKMSTASTLMNVTNSTLFATPGSIGFFVSLHAYYYSTKFVCGVRIHVRGNSGTQNFFLSTTKELRTLQRIR